MKQSSTVLVNTIALGFLVGVVLGEGWPLWFAGGLFAVLLAGQIFLVKKSPRYAFWTAWLLFAVAGCLAEQMQADTRQSAWQDWYDRSAVIAGTSVKEAEIVSLSDTARQTRYTIDVWTIRRGETEEAVSGKVLATVYEPKTAPIARIGDVVNLYGTIREVRDFQNPGRIDRAAVLARDGIYARMNVSEGDVRIAQTEGDWRRTISEWRAVLRARMETILPRDEAAVLFGMLFGGYQGIPPEWIEAFSVLGILHILSVSGAHAALIGGMTQVLCRAVRLRGIGQLAVVTAVILTYAAMAGFTVPIVRASVMGLLVIGN